MTRLRRWLSIPSKPPAPSAIKGTEAAPGWREHVADVSPALDRRVQEDIGGLPKPQAHHIQAPEELDGFPHWRSHECRLGPIPPDASGAPGTARGSADGVRMNLISISPTSRTNSSSSPRPRCW